MTPTESTSQPPLPGRRRVRTSEVGRTGARFGSMGSHTPAPAVPEQAHSEPVPPDAASGPIGARFGPYSQRRRKRHEFAEPEPEELTHPEAEQLAEAEPRSSGDEWLPSESDVLIRPYARTGGRTRPSLDLAIEALISTSPRGADGAGRHRSWEQQTIANLCLRPRSVAEVAALLSIPLGVARILLVDMATAGMVIVHGSTGHRPPDMVLMRRVLAGLRRL